MSQQDPADDAIGPEAGLPSSAALFAPPPLAACTIRTPDTPAATTAPLPHPRRDLGDLIPVRTPFT